MNYYLSLDKNAKDKRVGELAKLFESDGIEVRDYAEKLDKPAICFLLPRQKEVPKLPKGSLVFGYANTMEGVENYISLSLDDEFVRENNYLTALAFKEILMKRFGRVDQKMLVMGYGKLTAELERVLTDADIHILNYNHHKVASISKKYGAKGYFEEAPLHEFPIIVNTIPKQVIKVKKQKLNTVYELANLPYGFDFSEVDIKEYDYNIEPALPGRYYPDKAAKVVYDCIKRVMKGITHKESIALCLTASPCSFDQLRPQIVKLCEKYNVMPVMSPNATMKNRFTNIVDFMEFVEQTTGNAIITTLAGCEVFSSRKDILGAIVAPATGNTIAKLANAITDTPVLMACKALLRNNKPCIMGISTNDALSGNASNIGVLFNRRNFYFVPFGQDDPAGKPYSMVYKFDELFDTVENALRGKQVQPMIR